MTLPSTSLSVFHSHKSVGERGVEHSQEQLDALYAEAAPYEEYSQEHVHAPCQFSEAEILDKARSARSGPKFIRLWSGDISGYDSHSEADLALCRMLAL